MHAIQTAIDYVCPSHAESPVCVLHVYTYREALTMCVLHTDIQKASALQYMYVGTTLHTFHVLNRLIVHSFSAYALALAIHETTHEYLLSLHDICICFVSFGNCSSSSSSFLHRSYSANNTTPGLGVCTILSTYQKCFLEV